MKVTAIKQQQKDSSRVNVFLDGRYALSLSDLELSNSGLQVGTEIDAETLEALEDQSAGDKAYAQAVNYISLRPRSTKELRDYLSRKGANDVASVIERLERIGLLNDRAFAESWIATRQALNPRSRQRLAQELAAKGVARDIVDDALAESGPDVELEALRTVIEKKRHLRQYEDPQKLMGYLARQGYSYDLVKKALEDN